MKSLSLFSLFLLLSSFMLAFADDCAEMNLITKPASPFLKIPIYDQKDTNLCYAYSAAQMIDYQLIKDGAPFRSVHPAWVALNYAQYKHRKGLYIGHTKEAIDSIRSAKNCRYDSVSSALISWTGKKDVPETSVLRFIEKYSSDKSDLTRAPSSTDELSKDLWTELKNLSLSPVQMVSKIVSPACPEESRQAVNVPPVSKYNYEQLPDDKAFENFLLKRLDLKASPISIAYCSKIWKDPDYDGIHLNFLLVRDSLSDDCDYHESLIVGKKRVNGQCQLLVRNSIGDRWWTSGKNWKCLCKNKSSGVFSDNCSPETHPSSEYSVEACWIPSDKLARNTGVVTFME